MKELHRRSASPDLPPELLELIADRLAFADYARFASVCRSWRSAVADDPHRRALISQWILLPLQGGEWFLYSPIERRFRSPAAPLPPPVRGELCFFTSSTGFVVVINNSSGGGVGNCLINPFTGKFIHLPPTPRHAEMGRTFKKAVVSRRGPPPDSPRIVAAVRLYGDGLMFCVAAGNSKWTKLPPKRYANYYIDDIVFHERRLYCLCGNLVSIMAFDFSGGREPSVTTMERWIREEPPSNNNQYFAITRRGELLLVIFGFGDVDDDDDGDLQYLSIFIFYEGSWVALSSLSDVALFLHENGRGFAEAVEQLPATTTAEASSVFKKNCLYEAVGGAIDEGGMVLEFRWDGNVWVAPYYPGNLGAWARSWLAGALPMWISPEATL